MSSDAGDLSRTGLYNALNLRGADFSMTSIQTASRFRDDNDDWTVREGLELAGLGISSYSVPRQFCAAEHLSLRPWASSDSGHKNTYLVGVLLRIIFVLIKQSSECQGHSVDPAITGIKSTLYLLSLGMIWKDW